MNHRLEDLFRISNQFNVDTWLDDGLDTEQLERFLEVKGWSSGLSG